MSLYAQLCCPEFLLQAWKRVECRKGMAGTDGQTIDAFRRDRDRNVTRISDSLKNGTYAPSPLRGVKISKNGGGFRRLGVPTVQDRIVFQGANRLLADVWDPLFAPLSFAYRSGRSIADAIDAVIERIRKDRVWFVKGDIRGCFDELSWDVLSACLRDWLPDESLRRLVNQAIRVPVVEGGQIRPRRRGIPQGSPLSPLLANLYLHSFDLQMLQQGFPVIRYADDWLLLVGSEPEAQAALQTAQGILSVLNIAINEEKSGIGNLRCESVAFLGHRIGAERIDADSSGWKRFLNALRQLQGAKTPSERIQARSALSHIRSMYRKSGAIPMEEDESMEEGER